jgi:hypothetical protein
MIRSCQTETPPQNRRRVNFVKNLSIPSVQYTGIAPTQYCVLSTVYQRIRLVIVSLAGRAKETLRWGRTCRRTRPSLPRHFRGGVRVDSAWTLKPTAAHLFPGFLNQLNESHVESLAFPARLPFKTLMKEARFNIDEFQSQYLCKYVESELNKWVPTFIEEELYRRVKPASFFNTYPVVRIVAALDAANSEAVTADRSSICIAKAAGRERLPIKRLRKRVR